MEDKELSSLEAYVLSTERQAQLEQFVPGTFLHQYFVFSQLLAAGDLKAITDQGLVAKLIKLTPDNALRNSVNIAHALKRIECETDPAQLKKALEAFNSTYLHYNFSFSKPTQAESFGEPESQEVQVFKPLQLSLEEAHIDPQIFSCLDNELYPRLNIEFMSEEVLIQFALSASWVEFPKIIPAIAPIIADHRELLEQIVSATLSQIDQLLTLAPNLIAYPEIVQQKLRKKYYDLFETDSNEYRDLLLIYSRLLHDIETLPEIYSGFRTQIRRQLLIIGIELGQLDHKLFEEYLKTPIQHYFYKLRSDTNQDNFFSDFYRVNDIPEETLFQTYFDEIFRTQDTVAPYDNYIEASQLNKTFAKSRILSGVPATEFQDILTAQELQSMVEAVEIEFSKSNPKSFERSEEVVVQIALKNVQSLIVRLYVLNSQAYFLKHNAPIQSDIDIDGLIPSTEQVLEIEANPLIRSKLDLKIPGLEGKAGVFVLELLGNGRSARAIIKKGCLKCVTMKTIAGTLVKILDEVNNVVSGEGAGLYLDGRFYSTNNPDGQALLPFAQYGGNKKLILTDGEFSELYENFSHEPEYYDLQITAIMPPETAIRGKRAKLYLQVKLNMGVNPAPLSLLSNFKLTCIFQGNESQVGYNKSSGFISTKNFPDLELPTDSNEFLEVELEIPPKALDIILVVSADIKPISRREKEEVLWEGQVSLLSQQGTDALYNYYLRMTSEGFLLEVRGRDGGLKDGAEVTIVQTPMHFVSSESTQVLRVPGGSIQLGQLEDVQILKVFSSDSSAGATFLIEVLRTKVKYPSFQVSLVEGDEFVIPLEKKLTEGERSPTLIRTTNYGPIESVDKWTYNDETQEITIAGLEKGLYYINLGYVSIGIKVYEGSHWGNNQYIVTENSVIATPSQYSAVCIRDVTIADDKVKVQLNGDFLRSEVSLYFFNFLTDSNVEVPMMLPNRLGILEDSSTEEQLFHSPQNVYLKSKLLDEELRYAIERKKQEKVMGNTLSRPQIALKRMEIGTTQTETQQAAKGTDYEKKHLNKLRKKMLTSKDGVLRRSAIGNACCANGHDGPNIPLLDFLADPAIIITGIKTNAQGYVEFGGLDFSKYSSVQVFVSNPEAVAHTTLPLNGVVRTSDLTHKLTFDPDLTYSEQLKCASVGVGEKFTVKDAANLSKAVDTIDKQFSLLIELAKPNGVELAWNWLGEWDKLSSDEKLKKYDEFTSHELNLFIKAKDPQFFVHVVRPFLSQKYEKSFVDKWLLDESLEEYHDSFADLGRDGTKLNALELALLVKSVRSTNPELAARITKTLEDLAKALPKNEEERRRMYDRILSCEFKVEEPVGKTMTGAMPRESPLITLAAESMAPKSYFASYGGNPVQAEMDIMNDEDEDSECGLECDMLAMEPPSEFNVRSLTKMREEAKPYYEKLDATKEYAETHYFKVAELSAFKSLVPFNQFYAELSRAFLEGKDAALTESFLQCVSNPTDAYAALAFTDLPFRAAKHSYTEQDRGYILTAGSPILIFHKVLESVEFDVSDSLLVAQKYFDNADRTYTDEDGEVVDKPVKQFLKNKVYGCQVIVSNTSSKIYIADILAEIPEGALPIIEEDYTFVKTLNVPPYSTASFEFHFYFPSSGSYSHFPANIAIRGVVRAVARSQILTVIDKLSIENLESFKDYVSSGNTELILSKLANKNFFADDFNIEDLLWMARDPSLYGTLISVFKRKRIFDARLWGFSILHSDIATFKELLNTREDILKSLGLYFQSTLLHKRSYRHLDYFPLVNARAHKLGTKSKITNTKFREVYRRFLIDLAEKPELEPYDFVAIAHYWVLQDRLLEAKQLIGERLGDVSGLQLDYIRAYLDLTHSGDLAAKYAEYPVKAWKDMFAQVASQLAEASQVSEYTEAHRTDEPNLDFSIEKGGVVNLEHTGLTEATLSIYEVSLEVLFCRNPFFSKGSQDFSFVAPNYKSKIQLDPNTRLTKIKLPAQYQNKNVLVEVEFNGHKKSTSHFATSLKVQVLELYGQVKVASPEFLPLPLTYIKAFAKLKSGGTQFYKDGYTDIRGRFDFVSLNTDILSTVSRFALFIEHEQYGSLIVEASPPPQ